eukprot:CAMPEP_0182443762 /NCGR_PEP_ID=MMETSP1172-20130603/2401_1 /TAXON_ID=708627 /ORGANISM="Timspurckia oligopyrenoides, Strain CCMP3278" /LENGTH=422 /DNA_ID=CAMNT_0024639127 /DNA_START=395 /DNA_END=1663 /DNA_ORIENTATION=+
MEEAIKSVLPATASLSPATVKELNLDHRCKSSRISGLDPFVGLESLSLNGIGLTTLEGLPTLGNLRTLELSDNRLTSGLDVLVGATPRLEVLKLGGNQIASLDALKPLCEFRRLLNLDLFENPVSRTNGYREKVFGMLKALEELDGADKDGRELEEEEDDDDDEDEAEESDEDDELMGKLNKSSAYGKMSAVEDDKSNDVAENEEEGDEEEEEEEEEDKNEDDDEDESEVDESLSPSHEASEAEDSNEGSEGHDSHARTNEVSGEDSQAISDGNDDDDVRGENDDDDEEERALGAEDDDEGESPKFELSEGEDSNEISESDRDENDGNEDDEEEQEELDDQGYLQVQMDGDEDEGNEGSGSDGVVENGDVDFDEEDAGVSGVKRKRTELEDAEDNEDELDDTGLNENGEDSDPDIEEYTDIV